LAIGHCLPAGSPAAGGQAGTLKIKWHVLQISYCQEKKNCNFCHITI
jgi:hypothetical protein